MHFTKISVKYFLTSKPNLHLKMMWFFFGRFSTVFQKQWFFRKIGSTAKYFLSLLGNSLKVIFFDLLRQIKTINLKGFFANRLFVFKCEIKKKIFLRCTFFRIVLTYTKNFIRNSSKFTNYTLTNVLWWIQIYRGEFRIFWIDRWTNKLKSP